MNKPITIAICFFIVLILGGGVIWPEYQELKILKEEIEAKEAELQYREEYFLNLRNLSEELKKYPQALAKIDSALPPHPSLPTLFNFFQKTTAQAGLILKEINPPTFTPSMKIEGIKEAELGLTVSGFYPSLKNFLLILEKSARLIEIEAISFSAPLEKEEPFIFDLTIKVHSY